MQSRSFESGERRLGGKAKCIDRQERATDACGSCVCDCRRVLESNGKAAACQSR